MTTTAVYGEISWNDDIYNGGERKSSKEDWLRLKDGSNEVRLVTNPFQYLYHRYKKEGDPGFGQKVNCAASNGGCPLCATGDKPKTRWLFGVIDRESKAYKILDVSYAVFAAVRKLARNTKSWGDPTKYDIDIIVDKKAPPNGYYTVQPIGKEPLSAADQALKDNVDLEDLKRRVSPPTAEQVQKRLDRLNGEGQPAAPFAANAASTSASKNGSGKGVMPQQPVVTDSEEDDDAFPAYQN